MAYIGHLLIVLAGIGLGLHRSRRLYGQVAFLRQTGRLLEALGQQLAYTPCPMPQLWVRLGNMPVFSDFSLLTATANLLEDRDFAAAFAGGVERCFAAGQLTSTGRQLLLEFAAGCGRYDYIRQQEQIRAYCRRIKDLERELNSEAAVKGRLYRVVGASAGGALALLLL